MSSHDEDVNDLSRENRAQELERLRVERAQALAVKNALRRKEVDYHLAAHDKKFAAINSSIERTGNQLELLSNHVSEMREERERERAVNQALTKEVIASRKEQTSTRMLLACTASVLVGIIGVIVTVLIATHAIS